MQKVYLVGNTEKLSGRLCLHQKKGEGMINLKGSGGERRECGDFGYSTRKRLISILQKILDENS